MGLGIRFASGVSAESSSKQTSLPKSHLADPLPTPPTQKTDLPETCGNFETLMISYANNSSIIRLRLYFHENIRGLFLPARSDRPKVHQALKARSFCHLSWIAPEPSHSSYEPAQRLQCDPGPKCNHSYQWEICSLGRGRDGQAGSPAGWKVRRSGKSRSVVLSPSW